MTTYRLLSLLARCALLIPATSTVLLTLTAPGSVTALLAEREGVAADFIAIFMAVIVLTGWLDVLINDLLPDGVHMNWALKRRHKGYAVLAAIYFAKAFAACDNDMAIYLAGGPVVIVYYIAAGFCNAAYTWLMALRSEHAT